MVQDEKIKWLPRLNHKETLRIHYKQRFIAKKEIIKYRKKYR